MSTYWEVIADSLAHWPLQETTGLIASDASGNGHHGALESAITFDTNRVTGPTPWLPNALRSPGGTNARCVIPDHPDLRGGGQMSIAAWIDMSDTTDGVLVTKFFDPFDKDWGLQRNSGNVRWASELDNSDYYSVATPLTASWGHVTVVYDNATGETKNYINGVLVVSQTQANQSASKTGNVVLFGHHYGTTATVASLAGVQFFNRVLSASEVAELYAGPEPTATSIPTIEGEVAVGKTIGLMPALWDGQSNGTWQSSHELELSADGLTSWQPVLESLDLASYTVQTSWSGKYLRLASWASNDGGTSTVAYSNVLQATAAPWNISLEIGEINADGCQQGQATLGAGLEAGFILPGE